MSEFYRWWVEKTSGGFGVLKSHEPMPKKAGLVRPTSDADAAAGSVDA